jgi:hypothetical protein
MLNILYHTMNVESLNSKFLNFVSVDNKTLVKWKERFTNYTKNIHTHQNLFHEQIDDFNIVSDSTIFASIFILFFTIFINQMNFFNSLNMNENIIFTCITHQVSLNQKQYLICKKVLFHFLFTQSFQENNVSLSQLLFYIKEKEKVNKNQIIKKIFCAMNLLSKRN